MNEYKRNIALGFVKLYHYIKQRLNISILCDLKIIRFFTTRLDLKIVMTFKTIQKIME